VGRFIEQHIDEQVIDVSSVAFVLGFWMILVLDLIYGHASNPLAQVLSLPLDFRRYMITPVLSAFTFGMLWGTLAALCRTLGMHYYAVLNRIRH